MPTNKKRVTFIPALEVQKILDKLCNEGKISHSKLAGKLVEEGILFREIFSPLTLDDNKNKNRNVFMKRVFKGLLSSYNENYSMNIETISKINSSEFVDNLEIDSNDLELYVKFEKFLKFEQMMKNKDM